MKRRSFFCGVAGAACTVMVDGCSSIGMKKYIINRSEVSAIDLQTKVPKPVGTMQMKELGTTGIKVSRMGFGSHMPKNSLPFTSERERMIREAFDLGVNLFDVYDVESRIYQYGPMGKYLKDVINNVVISITMTPEDNYTVEMEMERDLKLFGRDYIDMVRLHGWVKDTDPAKRQVANSQPYEHWDYLFRFKEQGKIRAVGVPIHQKEHLVPVLDDYPIDYVILPFNFYHNWYAQEPHDFSETIRKLKKRGIGVVTMKPFLGDRLVTPFRKIAASLDNSHEINFSKACLRYIINADNYGLIDATLVGMLNPHHVYENIDAFYHPEMTDEERRLLANLRRRARVEGVSQLYLPEYYRFLDEWAPETWNDRDLFPTT